MTREELQNRFDALNAEFDKGQARLRELQQQEALLHETLLRISGARQVMKELLEEETSNTKNKDFAPESVENVS